MNPKPTFAACREVEMDDAAWRVQKSLDVARATIEGVEEVTRVLSEPGEMTQEKALRVVVAALAQDQRVREIVQSRPPNAPVRERAIVVDRDRADVEILPARARQPA